MNARKGALAAAAASLFLANTGTLLLPGAAAAEDKVKCEGVNSCKGSSACKTLLSSCKGHNECKGKGFVMLTPEECEKAKAELAKEKQAEEGEES
jgi:hypothetical protein